MARINVLPFSVANLIAAGEVVDRPASVIKELMENAIDAGATRLTVEIQNGGVTFMRVTDNGCGMTAEDLPVAIRRHATSKIRDASDLDGILTLGFRGEALAAIAAVSDMRILSKTKDAPFGTMLEAHGGEIVGLHEQGCSDGTSVIVENLFANVPARRKFLKKDVTESMAVTANVEKIALSNPQIAVRLVIDGNVKLDTAGDGNLKNTIYSVFGREFASRLIEVESDNEGIEVRGFIGRTDNFKANRNYQNFFINGRFVKSKTAMAALEQAYVSYMPPEKFPCCVLYLSINPARVDVNVHPAKLEVKFSNEKAVFEAVYYTVRTALENNVTRPVMQLDLGSPRKKSFANAGRVSDATTPITEGRQPSLQSRQISYDLSGQTAQPQMRMTAQEFRDRFAPEEHASRSHEKPIQPQAIPVPTPKREEQPREIERAIVKEMPKEVPKEIPKEIPKEAPKEISKEPIAPASAFPQMPEEHAPQKPETPVTEEKPAEKEAPKAPDYRIVGEVFHSYVIVETGDRMLIIDKHAAHERILFEQLKAALREQKSCSQLLMLPVDVMMTSAEVESLKQYESELEQMGFALRFARNTVSADAIPEEVTPAAVPDMLQSMAGRILSETGNAKLTRDILFEKALYQAACKAAIKAGRAYADEHVAWIVKKLMECPDITFCPHGRPVAMELSHHTLDRQFDRMGF